MITNDTRFDEPNTFYYNIVSKRYIYMELMTSTFRAWSIRFVKIMIREVSCMTRIQLMTRFIQ